MNERARMLQEAESLVNGDRNVQYGDPKADFKRTAEMWSAFLGTKIEPWQVASMMCLLKLSRISWSPQKMDSWVDLAGYAACGWDCAAPLTETADPELEALLDEEERIFRQKTEDLSHKGLDDEDND